MNYCVIQTGGKQYKVAEGEAVKIEKMSDDGEVGKEVSFSDVLLVNKDGTLLFGDACKGKVVKGVLEEVGRGKKLSIIKFKSKSNYKRQYGHRQSFWKVRISSFA